MHETGGSPGGGGEQRGREDIALQVRQVKKIILHQVQMELQVAPRPVPRALPWPPQVRARREGPARSVAALAVLGEPLVESQDCINGKRFSAKAAALPA